MCSIDLLYKDMSEVFQMKGLTSISLDMIEMDVYDLSLWFSWFGYLFDKNLFLPSFCKLFCGL